MDHLAFILITLILSTSQAADPTWTNLHAAVSLNENTATGTSLYRIEATDADFDSLSYTQISGTSEFQLDGQVVKTIVSPDYENGPIIYSAIFSVTDGTTTATGTLTINVADVNEYSPVISSTSITGSVEEEKPVGTTVSITFSASDADSNDVLEYSLSVNSYFSILSSTGTISTSTVLDRDTAASTTYNILLMVSDGTYTSTASLTINLTDINDNAPVFGSSFYIGSVVENAVSGTSVASVLATDVDDGVNKVFTYAKISGDPFSMFSITGNDILTTSVPVNYETNTIFTLIITATDTGSSPLTGTTTVQISVSGVNEFIPAWDVFTPAWTSDSTPFDVSENSAIGTTVVTIKATDLDNGLDGDITYEIDSITTGTGTGPTTGLFRLDSVTGILSTIGTFDFENTDAVSYYDILVKAKDTGSPVRSIVRTVRVGLTDFNDNEPVFTSASNSKTISETSPVGTSVFEFTVTDADSTSTYIFSITSGDTGGFFEFDSSITNKLQLKSLIDLDSPTSASDTYNLQITVTDGGSPELTGTAYITVSVASINEHTPEFTASSISVTVSESASIGYTLKTVLATDSDYGGDGEVEYSIVSGNTDTTFRVDTSQGHITLIKTLDYETTQTYVLTIQAKDGGGVARVATSTVSVTVSDVNDNEPTCTSMPSISVLEPASIGDTIATLSCNDDDNGATLAYIIAIPQFVIDSSGIIKLGTVIDYDSAIQSYSFDVTVSDGSMSTTVGIIVIVTAVNEHTPSFTDVTSTVAEDLAVGTSITVFTAIDIDYSPHDITSYTISSVSNGGSDKFTIDAGSGEIKLSKALDYEAITTKYYEIIVVATDGGGLRGTGTVTVSVTDVNDNMPSCLPSLHVLSIAENTIPSVIIADLECSDADSGTNGDLGFTLSQTPGTAFSLLESGSTVSLNLTGSIDYETVRSYTLTVAVVDSGSTALSTTVSIDISVTDVNDGGPSFSGTYTVSLYENITIGSDIQTVTATDPDNTDSPFGNLIYSIISGDIDNKFTIDSSSGQISVNGELDRETTENYLLVIQAIEQAGTNSASTTVNITVLDVNDNIPSCSTMSFSIEIDESTPTGTNLQSLNCSDNDSATYGTLTYTFLSGDTTVLELSSNILKLKTAVDFESGTTSYDMIINVSDGTNVVTVTGTVGVNDINEASPVFTAGSYNVSVAENSTVGTTIATVAATDADTADVMTYSITPATTFFIIGSVSGIVLLTKQLDRETTNTHSIGVAVTDGTNTTTATVVVTVIDVNDNTPLFNPVAYSGSVSEDDLAGASVILTVVATDADDLSTESNGAIVFSIIDGDPSNHFQFNSSTGELITTQKLDFEYNQSYSIVIKAVDRAGDSQSLSATAFVTVTVVNVNECDPEFNDTYAHTISEDMAIGTSVIRVFTTDGDSGVDGDVYYSCPHTKFYIDSDSGIIYVKDNLDYETVTSYLVEVTAQDQGTPARSVKTNVSISISDVNDNSPLCASSSYSSIQREDVPVGTNIANVSCTDADSGVNGNLSYDIHSVNGISGTGSFTVDSSGIVTTASSLNYEGLIIHVIVVFVNDGGNPQRTTNITINVAVSDVNEHSPAFSLSTYTVNVSEALSVGSVILNLTAIDMDTHDSIYFYFNLTNEAFDLDYTTGQMKIKYPLDKETTAGYTLVVFALDSGTTDSSRSSSATVTITVVDENEKPPMFYPSSYIVSVSENAVIGTTLVSLNATDTDNEDVTYSVVSGNTGSIFALNVTTGILELASALDYETATEHTLVVKAEDTRGLNTTGTVVISVNSFNEFTPVFSSGSNSTVLVAENTTVGAHILTLLATDADNGDDGTVIYTLNASTSNFSIERTTGVFKIANILDRETTNQFIVDILAIDGGVLPTSFTATYSLTVSITDVNDIKPVCTSNAVSLVVSEDTAVSINLLQITCTDSDDDPDSINNKTTFAILSGNTGNAFHLNISTGQLVLLNSLDREVTSWYNLVVEVSDTGSPVLSTTVNVFITISDVNDNSPIFSNDTYSFVVDESTAISSAVGQVVATDVDSGEAGTVYYSIISGNEAGKFTIDTISGSVKVVSTLDAEDTTFYNLTIKGIDNGNPVLTSSANFVITVNDVNDNTPSCPQSVYSMSVDENVTDGYEVLQFMCSDNDLTSIVSYYLISSVNEFTLNNTNGVLAVQNQSLDSETMSSFTLLINVTDQTYSTTVTIHITISDINEHAPEYSPSGPFTISISEDFQIAGTIYAISATDNDSSNSSLVYSIVSGVTDSEITISANTGVIQLRKSLDAETVNAYHLGLEVTDGVYTSTTNITITVLDVNDNDPSCDQSLYSVSFDENITIGSTILTPSCSDGDVSNTALLFVIMSGNEEGKFEISNTSGIVTLDNSLDYETTTQYTLTISLADNGTPSLSITYKIYVTVLPINEQAPTFGSINYNVIVAENIALNSEIIIVNASDSDIGLSHGIVTYTIVSGDGSGQFSITTLGKLKPSRVLDREATDFYNLTVLAYDSNLGSVDSMTATTYVAITVSDINDNYPKFSENSYSVSLYESTVIGATVQVLSATDDDINENGQNGFSYSIMSGNTGNTFNITENKIILAINIDRETASFYKLQLQVQDNGTTPLADNAYLHVEVLAVNEHTPKYTNDSNNITVSETVAIGTILYTFSATDGDTGDYGTLRYYISGNVTYSEFLLDEYTGQLTVWSALDYDVAPTEYNITVQAIDKGYNASDSLSDYMWLYIVLTDENDHTPTFSQNVYTFTIDENVNSDYTVGAVVASDGDSGNNGNVTYSVVSGDGSTTFSVNETTGEVITLSTIDYELKTLYSVVIEAKDNGTNSLSSRCLVKVIINDLNDNSPTFQPDDFAINIFENITVGTSITSMYAVDADSSVSNNNVFTYLTDSDTFAIDSSTGIITTTSTLDREIISSYILSITALDQGTPAMTGTATVTILIDDVNDNDPVIYGTYQVSVDENAGINTVVTTVNATDADSDENGQLTFSIVSGNTDSDFKIDASMGLIQIANSLDRERTSSYVLGVDIIDGGEPVRTTSVNVTISISDINDNGPVFTSVAFSFSVAEDVSVEYDVGNVTATDADTGNNGDISYSIPIFWLGINSHFSINESTGIISTAGTLDRETYETYYILCRISDNGSPMFTNAVNITIIATDVNDNDPVFNASSYSASFPENEATGTTILPVFVTDIDSGVNQDVTLTIDTTNIEGQTANTYIALNSTLMTLSVKQNIDREMTPIFQFTLVATDGGSPPRSSTVSISLIVEDLNDNSPSFSSSFYNFEIPYNDDCHVTVGVVAASDSDYNDTVLYFITTIEHLNIFSLNSSSGVITLTSTPLENTKYELDILASDTALNNGTTKVRVDTFESESVMVTFTLGMSKLSFEPLEQTFFNQLDSVIQQNYTNSKTRKWCIKETSVSEIDLSIYVLEDNSTDSYSNVAQNKTFLSTTTVISLLTTSNGSVALTGNLWDQFNISSITSFTASSTTSAPSNSAEEKWIESTTGIAVLCTIIALVIIGVVATICLVKACRSPKIISQVEMIKAKREAFKVDEESLTKPVVVTKPTMQMENDEFEDSKAPSHTGSRIGTAPSHTSSRIGTAQTIKSNGIIVTRKNPFRRNSMSVDNMKVENVDKVDDEIDKSKLAPPVIVRGPMPKIEKNTYYKEVDFWNSMVPPNATTITNTVNRRHTKPREHKVERSTVTRYFDPAIGQTVEYDTKTNTRRVVADDKN